MPSSQANAADLTLHSIQAIFGKRDATKRLHTISETWFSDGEVLFVGSLGVCKTHGEISGMVDKIQGFGEVEGEFVELSERIEAVRELND